ncbi:MAG: NUDIX hydrolase [Planctomycetota bacterium]
MDSQKTVLETPRFGVVEHRFQSGDEQLVKYSVQHPGAVVILPILEDATEPSVVLIKNYRIAVDQTLIEAPAGTLEPPEPPLKTAQRELTEETGYTAENWTELPGFTMSPGILNERMYCFVAKGLTPGEPAREPGEEIENLVMPIADAIALAERGEIEDAKTLVALLRYHAFS